MCLSDRHAVFRAACPYSLYHTVPPCGNAAAAFLEENMKKRLLSGLVLLALLQCLMLPAFAEPTDAPADPTEPSASETAANSTDAPTDGTVDFCGENILHYPEAELRRRMAVVLQKSVLFRGTLRENMQWEKTDATDGEIEEALRTAQALEVVQSKAGLDEKVQQGGRNFSGGQRQRLSIARALVKKAEVLILDDSSSALDYATEAKLRAALAALSGQLTLFVISQRASAVMHADKILVLDNGELVGVGTHESLLRDCAVYREIYASQSSKEAIVGA